MPSAITDGLLPGRQEREESRGVLSWLCPKGDFCCCCGCVCPGDTSAQLLHAAKVYQLLVLLLLELVLPLLLLLLLLTLLLLMLLLPLLLRRCLVWSNKQQKVYIKSGFVVVLFHSSVEGLEFYFREFLEISRSLVDGRDVGMRGR